MGKIKQGILGGFSGSVAGVTGSSWKGIAVIKAKPLSVANPKTASQTANRNAFKAVAQAGSNMLVEIVKPLWDRNAQRESGYNAFIKKNKSAFNSLFELLVSNFYISIGKLQSTPMILVNLAPGQTEIGTEWNNAVKPVGSLDTDIAYLVAYNENTKEFAISGGEFTRYDEGAVANFKTNLVTGDVISFYLAFRSADGFSLYSQGSDLSNTVQ